MMPVYPTAEVESAPYSDPVWQRGQLPRRMSQSPSDSGNRNQKARQNAHGDQERGRQPSDWESGDGP